MADGLQKSAGAKLKKTVEILTTNKLIGMLVGAFVTMIIQSSSATTVMVIGFVNAGIMSLIQATGVIMGANIGTTITAQMVSLDLSEIAPAVVGIAVGVWIFSKNKKTTNLAEIFIGFGILFLGMELMKTSLKPLRELQAFQDLILSFDPSSLKAYLLAIGVGFLFTALVQSSSATTGILIAMAFEGLISIEIALPIIFGTNIGTCVTALISSIGATRTAKRAATIHLLFNVIGTFVFIIFFRDITIYIAKTLSPDNTARQLANAHTFFNITNTLLLLPFSSYLVVLANKLIPENEDEKDEYDTYLDDRMLGTPSIALGQVTKEIISMGELSLNNYDSSVKAITQKNNNKEIDKVFKIEEIINSKQRSIERYLVKLTNETLSSIEHEKVNMMLGIISDIERIGDHAENIAELAEYINENNLRFSEQAVEELMSMHSKVVKSCKQVIEALETGDTKLAYKIISREDRIDAMEKDLRASHIDRLNKGLCSTGSGIIFLDAISNMERVADHAEKIAYYVIDTSK
ncbi:MAG: Na/Pi cotransporter family protein [Clostridia bacterium]|nr:Na/Pi cotransporter family protein [Clostridia bacterium]